MRGLPRLPGIQSYWLFRPVADYCHFWYLGRMAQHLFFNKWMRQKHVWSVDGLSDLPTYHWQYIVFFSWTNSTYQELLCIIAIAINARCYSHRGHFHSTPPDGHHLTSISPAFFVVHIFFGIFAHQITVVNSRQQTSPGLVHSTRWSPYTSRGGPPP